MPASSSGHPQNPQSRRSRAFRPYPLPAPNNTGASNSSVSLPSGRFRAPGQDVNAMATSVSHPSSAGNSMSHPHSIGCAVASRFRATDDFESRPSRVSRPVTPIVVEVPTSNLQSLVAQPPGHSPYPRANSVGLTLPQQSLPSQNSVNSLAAPSQQIQGLFHQSHDFSATGNFIDGNVGSIVYITNPSNQFMKDLLQETIPGAAFDSSARDPPPRCHPGTRLAVLRRCMDFISQCDSTSATRLRWVVGAAGVGKSAIMQNVAESPKLPGTSQASVFFSINERNDGTKAVLTLSYQFAAKSEAYRRVIEDEITRDPSLVHSSMSVQFEKLIVEPFIHNAVLNTASRVLVIIDGLDECSSTRTQVELLRLISNFCILYPSSPIAWLIASRPETHIASFFARTEVTPLYEKEEILVDSDEGRADVERFLRNELMETKNVSDSLDPQWPNEQDLWKVASAAGGLFAYAHTVIRYIGDSTIGNPASLLSDVLHVIDNHPLTGIPPEDHPMALLDALYARIISNVPARVMINTRKLLLALASPCVRTNFILLCNFLGMTAEDAYAAINHLRSALCVPRRDEAHQKKLEPFHKSFIDYLCDFSRSRFSSDMQHEARELNSRCTFKILNEAPDGIDFGERRGYVLSGGVLARGPGCGDNISLTWLVGEELGWGYNGTRLRLYKLAIAVVMYMVRLGETAFQSEFCIRALTTGFRHYNRNFPLNELCDLVFDGSRRHDFITHGILKQIPLQAVDVYSIYAWSRIKLQFRRPASKVMNLPDPWYLSCEHARRGEWKEGRDQNWVTSSDHYCIFCYGRLHRHLESLMARSPNYSILILLTSARDCCAELRFVDVEDEVSEWTYWFWCKLTLEGREKFGNTV